MWKLHFIHVITGLANGRRSIIFQKWGWLVFTMWTKLILSKVGFFRSILRLIQKGNILTCNRATFVAVKNWFAWNILHQVCRVDLQCSNTVLQSRTFNPGTHYSGDCCAVNIHRLLIRHLVKIFLAENGHLMTFLLVVWGQKFRPLGQRTQTHESGNELKKLPAVSDFILWIKDSDELSISEVNRSLQQNNAWMASPAEKLLILWRLKPFKRGLVMQIFKGKGI